MNEFINNIHNYAYALRPTGLIGIAIIQFLAACVVWNKKGSCLRSVTHATIWAESMHYVMPRRYVIRIRWRHHSICRSVECTVGRLPVNASRGKSIIDFCCCEVEKYNIKSPDEDSTRSISSPETLPLNCTRTYSFYIVTFLRLVEWRWMSSCQKSSYAPKLASLTKMSFPKLEY